MASQEQGSASQVPESQAQAEKAWPVLAVLESEQEQAAQAQGPVAQAGQESLAEKAARVEPESQAQE